MLELPDRKQATRLGHVSCVAAESCGKASIVMSRPCRLPRSIPVCVLAMLAVCGGRAALAGPVAPDGEDSTARNGLIDIKIEQDDSLHVDADFELAWNDLGIEDAGGTVSSGPARSLPRVNVIEPKSPPVIAAPLPPAVLSGLIGLAGVYVYKRRNRLR